MIRQVNFGHINLLSRDYNTALILILLSFFFLFSSGNEAKQGKQFQTNGWWRYPEAGCQRGAVC